MATVADRIEARVDRSGGLDACHLWTGYVHPNGYGSIAVGSRTDGSRRKAPVHVLVLEAKLGRKLGPGKKALHDCPGGDNPKCCNPLHLWEGTQAENVADAVAKGRASAPRGEESPNAKLTEADVRAMRTRRKGGASISRLAREFGVSWTLAKLIVTRRAWRHVA